MKNFTPEMTEFILRSSPFQPRSLDLPGKQFPADKPGRHFMEAWYHRRLDDGSTDARNWLAYSIKEDKAFCLHYKLFGSYGAEKPNRAWICDGFSSWSNGQQRIKEHESSPAHIVSSLKFNVRQSTLPLHPSFQSKRKAAVEANREVVRQIITVIVFLAVHCMSFRGHREGLSEENRGNFLDMITLVAGFSAQLSSYSLKLNMKKKPEFSFLSWRRQNQLLRCIALSKRKTIVERMKRARFFSISVDTTFDVAKHEQVSFVSRFANEETGRVEERPIALRQSASTTREALASLFQNVCEENNLDWKNDMVGQSYDGASNMRGEYRGMQAIIKAQNPFAVYVWCWAHRLALIIVQAVSSCIMAKNMFGNLERLFSFLTDGKKRVALYESYQKSLCPGKKVRRLKKVSTTRWISHSFALDSCLETFLAVAFTLEEIKETSDGQASAEADGLLKYLCSEEFLLPAFVFKKCFEILRPFTKILQSPEIDLLMALGVLQISKERIVNMRNEACLISVIEEAREFAAVVSSDSEEKFKIEQRSEKRIRRKKLMPGEECPDDPVTGALENFKIDFFYTVLDCILCHLDERFGTGEKKSQTNAAQSKKGKGKGKGKSRSAAPLQDSTPEEEGTYDLLCDLSWLSPARMIQVKDNPESFPTDTFTAIYTVYDKFLNYDAVRVQYMEFVQYFETFKECVPQTATTAKISGLAGLFYMFCAGGLKAVFPDLFILVKIGVTLPVTSVTVEREFSKLKLILTRLRSTMDEERLEALMLISCESDVPHNVEEIINSFAMLSSVLQRELL